jgi:hypothetical protein
MSYVKRRLDVTFSLGTGKDGDGPPDIYTYTGMRVSAAIVKAGGAGLSMSTIRIFGMGQDVMNRLSTLGQNVLRTRRNGVSIKAGDDVAGMALVFQGTIQNGWADYRGAPDVCFSVDAQAGLIEALKPVAPSSYPGGADVATIMADLAAQMGVMFENNGVQVQISNPYFPGTALNQAQQCARAADINMILDNGTLAIWPKSGSRGGAIPVISAQNGMVGYPTFTSQGVAFRCLYTPAINYGATVQMQSELKPACGKWVVNRLIYNLESETPGGAWFTDVEAGAPGYIQILR